MNHRVHAFIFPRCLRREQILQNHRDPFDVYYVDDKEYIPHFGFDRPTLWALSSSCLGLSILQSKCGTTLSKSMSLCCDAFSFREREPLNWETKRSNWSLMFYGDSAWARCMNVHPPHARLRHGRTWFFIGLSAELWVAQWRIPFQLKINKRTGQHLTQFLPMLTSSIACAMWKKSALGKVLAKLAEEFSKDH